MQDIPYCLLRHLKDASVCPFFAREAPHWNEILQKLRNTNPTVPAKCGWFPWLYEKHLQMKRSLD